MVDSPEIDESEKDVIRALQQKFRSGVLTMDEYIKSYPAKSTKVHEEVWHEIFEAHSKKPEESAKWRGFLDAFSTKGKGPSR